jgi:ribosome-binding ATPase YchF (GTP1/OBG family)
VGKSTLFNILTKQSVNAANYPFATINPNIGVVSVPDERLDELTKLSNSKEKIPAVVEFYDIAGLVKGANKGEGLGNKFLSHIKETDAILHMVRVFEGRNIVHIEGNINPMRDVDIVEDELVLKDLDVVERQFKKQENNIKTGDKDAKKNYNVLVKIRDVLESAELLASAEIGKDEDVQKLAKQLNLLTIKKQLFLLNGEESDISDKLKEKINNMDFDYVITDLGNKALVPNVIQKAYETLNLISFFTTGEKESRAWTCPKWSKAPQAAGVIHSDFEKKFIRAETVSYKKLIEAGSWGEARNKGWIRVEGKDYVVQDGDVMYFRTGK